MTGASENIERLIAKWQGAEGGQERANYALFLAEFCDALDLPRPDPAGATSETNDYVFERAVTFREPDGSTAHGRIDLYKRCCFVLEAKQSRWKGGKKAEQGEAEQRVTHPALLVVRVPTPEWGAGDYATNGSHIATGEWDVPARTELGGVEDVHERHDTDDPP